MKKRTKVLSIFLTLTLILATMLPLAASAAGNASITVNGPSGLVLNANDFSAYKLFDVEVSGTGANKSFKYTPVAGLNGFLAAYPAYGANAEAFQQALAANTIDMYDLTRDLRAYFTSGGIAATQINGTSVKFNNLDYGYYLVAGKGQSDGVDVIAHCSLVTVDEQDADVTISLKADAPEIEKEVWNHNLDDGNGDWTDWTDINMGYNAEFKLTSKVPDMTGYKSYTYIVHDRMSKGLSFNNDVEVIVGGSPFTDFTVTVSPIPTNDPDAQYAGGTYIKIEFDPNVFVTLAKDVPIEIFYSAELNENAIIGAPGNPNKVRLEYSNNPYDEDDTGDTPWDEVIVYTFDLEIFKYTGTLGGDDEYPLAGAEFELRDSNGNVMSFIKINDGEYRLATSEDNVQNIVKKVISNENGQIHIDGLDAGEYDLEETKAPVGYNMIPGFITKIRITHDDQEGAYTVYADESETNVVNTLNNKGSKLPETGGIGRTIFYALGAILMFGAGAALFIRRRKTVNK